MADYTIAGSANDNYAVSVGTTAVKIVTQDLYAGGSGQERHVVVTNDGGTGEVIYIGFGSDTTTVNGTPVADGSSWSGSLHSLDEVWCDSDTAATDVRVAILHGKGDPA